MPVLGFNVRLIGYRKMLENVQFVEWRAILLSECRELIMFSSMLSASINLKIINCEKQEYCNNICKNILNILIDV